MSERQPAFCVLNASGINCHTETARGIRLAGGSAEQVHINELTSGERSLDTFQGLMLPGGFSEGDAVRAGAILATHMRQGLGDQLQQFADAKKPIMGICNGFQVLVNSGLLPAGRIRTANRVALADNISGTFRCDWVNVRVDPNGKSPLMPEGEELLALPIANAEGRFVADKETRWQLFKSGQVLMRYASPSGEINEYDTRTNPSGAQSSIAAICNDTGTVVGMMPHPERYVYPEDHPNHRRPEYADGEPQGLRILRSLVEYAAGL